MDSTAMSWREHIRQNIQLAVPLIIGQLATIGIWTSDTIAMGWSDSSSLATDALTSRFYQPFFSRAQHLARLRPDQRLGRVTTGAQRGLADSDHAHDVCDAAHPRLRFDPAGLGRASRIWTPGFHSL